MKRFIFLILSTFLITSVATAQNGMVPKKISFAGMTLNLNNAAQGKIQAEVNKIRKSERHFQAMVDKANIYFPVVEEVFRQENFPDDIKYLLIQESAFNADAVSTSNAVGFWQFKEGTAKEVGLEVGGGIDERKNLAAASRGAAKYMSKTNLKVRNWVYALLSYNVGPGGVLSHVKDKYVGANKMDIDGHIHWYVIKFLAHKIAYESEIHTREASLFLSVRDDLSGKNLKQIAKKEHLDEDLLIQYNRWIGSGKKIPDDRPYWVIVPTAQKPATLYVATPVENTVQQQEYSTDAPTQETPKKGDVVQLYDGAIENVRYKVNDVDAIVAVENDNSHKLALAGDITKKKFIKYNEIQTFTQLIPGVTYFLSNKKNKARLNFHTVKKGETVWDISQMYAIKTKAIRKKNRMGKREEPEEGRVLWLRDTRPQDTPIAYRKPKVETPKTELEEVKKPVILEEKKAPVVIEQKIPEEARIEKETVVEITPENQVDEIKETMFLTHRVQAGETLYAISKKYSVNLDSIKKYNNLISNDLSLGMELKIKPAPTNIPQPPIETKPKTYVVQQGDTFYSISKKFNIGVPDLLEKNNKTEPSLSIGEKLIVE